MREDNTREAERTCCHRFPIRRTDLPLNSLNQDHPIGASFQLSICELLSRNSSGPRGGWSEKHDERATRRVSERPSESALQHVEFEGEGEVEEVSERGSLGDRRVKGTRERKKAPKSLRARAQVERKRSRGPVWIENQHERFGGPCEQRGPLLYPVLLQGPTPSQTSRPLPLSPLRGPFLCEGCPACCSFVRPSCLLPVPLAARLRLFSKEPVNTTPRRSAPHSLGLEVFEGRRDAALRVAHRREQLPTPEPRFKPRESPVSSNTPKASQGPPFHSSQPTTRTTPRSRTPRAASRVC